MEIKIDYGREGLVIDLPDHTQVIRSQYVAGLPDEVGAIQDALRNPIGSLPLVDIVKSGDKVVIVHTDITRATPNDRLLPVILHELEFAGVNRHDIILINGLGTHRFQTEAELRQMLSDFIVDNYRCLQHDAYAEDNLVTLGKTFHGNPIRINKDYLGADVRILTGFIEPHFFAGFSGGPKAVLPALAGFESVGTNHCAANIALPNATWGNLSENPVWEEMKEVALKTEPSFLVNITLNADKEISGVFAGDMLAAHAEGCKFVKEHAMVAVEETFDVVITTNSGYPLDQNLYQSVKGMSAASKILSKGGTIISVTACEDGVPEHGGYADLLRRGGSPQGVLNMVTAPDFNEPDQWQVQIQALIQMQGDVYVFSDGLSDEEIRQALFLPCRDIPSLLRSLETKYGTKFSIAVMPEGPQSVPYLAVDG
ncbi:MAG: nickel-dependent lactate racemase [Chloroflexota bacterium]